MDDFLSRLRRSPFAVLYVPTHRKKKRQNFCITASECILFYKINSDTHVINRVCIHLGKIV